MSMGICGYRPLRICYMTGKANLLSIISILSSFRWDYPPAPIIIEIDKDKNLFVAYASKGIYKYNNQSKDITIYKQSENNNDLDLSEIAHVKIKDHFVWVLHKNGVLERINTETGMVDIRNTFFKENLQNSTIRKSIFIDNDNDVWIFPQY